MRQKLRVGVFETNSSSTHNLIVSKTKLDTEELENEFRQFVNRHFACDYNDIDEMPEHKLKIYRENILSKYPNFPDVPVDDEESQEEFEKYKDYWKTYAKYRKSLVKDKARRIFGEFFCNYSGEGGTLDIKESNQFPTYQEYLELCAVIAKNYEDEWVEFLERETEKVKKYFMKFFNMTEEECEEKSISMIKSYKDFIYKDLDKDICSHPISEDEYNEILKPFTDCHLYEIDIDYGFRPLVKQIISDERWDFYEENDDSYYLKVRQTKDKLGFSPLDYTYYRDFLIKNQNQDE